MSGAVRELHLSYGGTFDPVHRGHLEVARSVARQLGSVVHLVPCADPPHRAPPVATAVQRAHMLELAIAGDACLALDRREQRRVGASYTIDTLTELRGELGEQCAIGCVIGADAFRGLPTWREWRRLFDLAHVLVLTRPGHVLDDLSADLQGETESRRISDAAALRHAAAGHLLELSVPEWDVSSTGVRRALAAGERPSDAVPRVVLDWILARGLYR